MGDSAIMTDASKITTLLGVMTGSDGATLTLGGAGINSLAQLAVDEAETFTIEGTIGGFQSLTKMGTGTLVLNGDSTYTGPTTVNAGFLVINGSIVSTLTVNTGSTIKGTGIYGPITVNSGATLSPGNSPGLMFADSVIFNPDSIFQVEINPDEHSALFVVGTATLNGGTVEIIQDEGDYPDSADFEILITGGGITGAFTTFSGGLPGFSFFLNQVDDSLFLSYAPAFEIPTAGLSGNRLSVANYLNNNANDETLYLLDGLSGSSLNSALDSISPARNAFGRYITEQTVRYDRKLWMKG
jgi:autotransporter-associated beta strand protein